MALKGIFKVVSQIFSAKEREMEIGCPTDVKHVAHIGWGSSSMGSASPSWMNEIMASPDLSSSLGNFAAAATTQDLDLRPRDASPFRASSGSDNTGHRRDATPRKTRRRKQKDEGSPPRPSSSRDSLSSAPPAAAADGAL